MDQDQAYKTIYKEAVRLQFKFRDSLDDNSQSAARSLENEIQKLVDEIEVKRNPRGLDDRVKSIQRQLKNIDQDESPVMEEKEADSLHNEYEHLRMDLRKLPGY